MGTSEEDSDKLVLILYKAMSKIIWIKELLNMKMIIWDKDMEEKLIFLME